jgi:hypothetical protein
VVVLSVVLARATEPVVRVVVVGVPEPRETERAIELGTRRKLGSADLGTMPDADVQQLGEQVARRVLRSRLGERPVIVVQVTRPTPKG